MQKWQEEKEMAKIKEEQRDDWDWRWGLGCKLNGCRPDKKPKLPEIRVT